MSKSLYVGNLPFRAKEEELKALFSEYGTVLSVKIIVDRDTGRPRGYGFVEMEEEAADLALKHLTAREFGGREIYINEAKKKQEMTAVGGF